MKLFLKKLPFWGFSNLQGSMRFPYQPNPLVLFVPTLQFSHSFPPRKQVNISVHFVLLEIQAHIWRSFFIYFCFSYRNPFLFVFPVCIYSCKKLVLIIYHKKTYDINSMFHIYGFANFFSLFDDTWSKYPFLFGGSYLRGLFWHF